MPVGTSTGEVYEDQFDFQTKSPLVSNYLSSGEGVVPKEGQTLPVPVTSPDQMNKSVLDFLTPESLKPMAPEETERRLRAFQEAKPGDKVPELENPAQSSIFAGATDALGMLPVGGGAGGLAAKAGAAKLAMAAGTKFDMSAFEAEMSKFLKGDVIKATKQYHSGDEITIPISDISQKGIDKTLADNPGASIFDIAKVYMSSMKSKVSAFEQKLDARIKEGLSNKYVEHLKPVDWQSVKSPIFPDVHKIELDPTSIHAKSLGFNVDFPLFKGGGHRPEHVTTVPDPSKKNYERGIFYTADPDVAKKYADIPENVGTYVARAPKALEVDWQKATGYKNYDESFMTPLIDAAHKQKADMLIVKNLHDIGGKQDQYVILNPSVVRRPDAAFDPDKLHLNHLLAGIGGLGVVAHEGLKQEK